MSHIQNLFTSGFARAMIRLICPSSAVTVALQPREHEPHTVFVCLANQTRAANRKFLSMRAPTGQMSTTFSDRGLSIGTPGKTSTTEWSPRLTTQSSPVPDTSSVNRTHRVQTMHRLPQILMLGPRSFVWRMFFGSWNRESPPRQVYV